MFLTRSEDIPRTGKPWRVVEAPNPDTTPCQIRRFRYTETCQYGIITANFDPDMDLLKGEAVEWLDGDEDDVKREVVLENTRSLPNLPALARFLNENPDMESLYCFTTAGFRAFIDNELPAIYGVASVTEGLLRGVDTTGLEPACVIWEEECYSLKDLGWLRLEHPDFGIRYVKSENWEKWFGEEEISPSWDIDAMVAGLHDVIPADFAEEHPGVMIRFMALIRSITATR